jgi:hypothetical protein
MVQGKVAEGSCGGGAGKTPLVIPAGWKSPDGQSRETIGTQVEG